MLATTFYYGVRIIFCALLILFILGCNRNKNASDPDPGRISKIKPDSLRFNVSEVQSRKWVDRYGRKMTFLDMEDWPLAGAPDLIIVKYGASGGTNVYCLDFYEKYDVPRGVEQSFILIAHDADFGEVISLSPTNETNDIVIRISRTEKPDNSSNLLRLSYYYTFDHASGLSRGLGEINTEVH